MPDSRSANESGGSTKKVVNDFWQWRYSQWEWWINCKRGGTTFGSGVSSIDVMEQPWEVVDESSKTIPPLALAVSSFSELIHPFWSGLMHQFHFSQLYLFFELQNTPKQKKKATLTTKVTCLYAKNVAKSLARVTVAKNICMICVQKKCCW